MTHGQGSPNAGAPPLLRPLLDGIDTLSRLDGWLGAGCLVTLTGLMLAEVLVRALSNVFPWVPADIPVAWEYSSYLMAATFTFGAAMTLRAGGHIRVTLVLARVSPKTRRKMETVLAVLGVCFCGYLAWAMAYFTWRSFDSGQTSVSSGTLVWIPRPSSASASSCSPSSSSPASSRPRSVCRWKISTCAPVRSPNDAA